MIDTMRKVKNIISIMGLTQKEVAQRAELSEAAVSRWMNGLATPQLYDFEKLCKALGLEIQLHKVDEGVSDYEYKCQTCKHNNKGWDEEPCDGCCGNRGYEPQGVS